MLALNGTGCHYARHSAACSDQHRDKGLSGKAKSAEDSVHDESNPRHVAAALQEGKKNEQHQHLGHEAENSTHAGHNAV